LDSQIPGDYEIIGQIRNAFQLSKKLGRANGYIEKVVNQAVLVSKTIKNTTAFSDGTVSVSYTVVQHIKKMMEQHGLKKIAVIGLGEIGYNTLKYLLQHVPEAEITIVNRDEKKLNEIAVQHQLKATPFTSLNQAVSENEILIFATGVSHPILYLDQIKNTNVRYIYDLSMPRNVAEEVYKYSNVSVYDVDQVSKVVNETIDKRLAEIPKVKAIVQEKAQEFFDWEKRRKEHTPAPAPYEQMNNHVIADTTHSHARQFACFMADQCCGGNPAAAWIPMRAYSA
jgi:glutamyl-tRNA reductase